VGLYGYLGVVESVVDVTFKSAFYLEMHQNNFFKKKSFLTPVHQNDPKILKT